MEYLTKRIVYRNPYNLYTFAYLHLFGEKCFLFVFICFYFLNVYVISMGFILCFHTDNASDVTATVIATTFVLSTIATTGSSAATTSVPTDVGGSSGMLGTPSCLAA